MRTKPGVDSLSFNDLYNNLRVFENDVKGSTASSSSTQNVAFVFENTSSTNDVSTAYGVSNPSGHNSQWWTIDGEGVDWTSHSEEEEDYALMACNSSGSDTEVTSCLNECKESYAKLKKLYDAQREQLSDASIEIQAYNQGLSKLKQILVAHQQEAKKEKEDLKAKVEKWHNSSKNLEIDYSQFTYGPKQSQTSESETQTSDFDTCESDCSVETNEPLPEPTVNEPKVVCQPKVWSDAPIIEEYESDSENEHVSLSTEEHETPSFANQQVKPLRETVKNQFTHSKNPTVDKKGLGYGFTTKACFVCGSLSHLIRDCDFHEKRMAKQAELNNRMSKKSSQREIRPIWNNVQRVNHKNQFVPTAVLTRTGKIPVNTARASGTNNVSTARHNFNRQAVPTNAAMKVNIVKPFVNRVNTAEVNAVSAVGGKRETAVKPLGSCKLETKGNYRHKDYAHRALQNKGNLLCGQEEQSSFHYSECLVLSPEFKLPDANQESNTRPPGKAKSVSSISHSLQLLHMDLFGPTSVRSLNHKTYCLVITDDFSRDQDGIQLMDKNSTTKLVLLKERKGPLIGTEDIIDADDSEKEVESAQDYFVIWPSMVFLFFNNQELKLSGRRKNAAILRFRKLVLVDLPCGRRQEEGIDYDEVFAPVARIEAIRIFLAFASYMGFIVYQMDVKSTFLYGKIDEEMSSMGELTFFLGLQGKQKEDGIFISQDKYVAKILKKFDFVSVKTASTPIETQKPLVKDEEASDVDVTQKSSHLNAVKRIFRYLKGKPKLGLWYPRVSSFDLESYSDSDYAEANLDRKSTTGEVEYVAAANCCGQVLWIQNQMLDYGFNFMNTKIYIDNESTICIVKNPIFHSKTKHIAIRHHFIKDAYEKKLIQVLKIHTDDNVADLLTKAFDVSSYLGYKESLQRDIDGTKELLLPNLLKSCFTKVSIDSAIFVPLGKSDPSPGPSPIIPIPDPLLEGSDGNLGSQSSSDKSLSRSEGGLTLQSVYNLYLSLCTHVTAQATKIKSLKAQVKKLKKQARPFILHHKAWLRTVKRKNQNKKKVLKTSKRRSVFKQGRKTVKSSTSAPTVSTNTEWEDLDIDIDDTMDYTLAQDEGKTAKVDEKGESTAQQQSTDRQDEGTNVPKASTVRTKLSIDKVEEGTAEPEPRESTFSAAQTPTPTTFGDDETIAQVLLNMSQAKAVSKEKEKGVEIINARNAERPRTTSTRSVLTLKPLPKIDPKDKGKKVIEEDKESDTESEEITEAKKKFDQIAHDEETALSNEYDFIKARIEADRLLAERVQEAEREQFTVEERAKFLHDTIATQRRILAQQRSEAIRNKPPTKNQFRNQMMTYLKHVGNKKHADLKTKSFDEIKALYEKVKRFDDSFITIGSTEDERKIKEMNEGASDPDKKKKIVKEDVSAKVPAKQDVAEQGTKKRKGGHMKMIARKRKRPQPDVDSDDEHRKCLKIVTFEGTIDSEIMETKSFISKLDKVSSPEGDYLVVYRVNSIIIF
ncbi:putative ribonuclease H-like domain-containing protein [Tanacetum coccineum]